MTLQEREETRKRRLTHPVNGLPPQYDKAVVLWRVRQTLGLTIADVQQATGLSKTHVINTETGRGSQRQMDELQAYYNEWTLVWSEKKSSYEIARGEVVA